MRGGVGDVRVSSGKERASRMTSVNEEGVEWVLLKEESYGWFGWGSNGSISAVGECIGSSYGCSVFIWGVV